MSVKSSLLQDSVFSDDSRVTALGSRHGRRGFHPSVNWTDTLNRHSAAHPPRGAGPRRGCRDDSLITAPAFSFSSVPCTPLNFVRPCSAVIGASLSPTQAGSVPEVDLQSSAPWLPPPSFHLSLPPRCWDASQRHPVTVSGTCTPTLAPVRPSCRPPPPASAPPLLSPPAVLGPPLALQRCAQPCFTGLSLRPDTCSVAEASVSCSEHVFRMSESGWRRRGAT